MITRFAPSPTGALHLGHAFSALTVWRIAQELGGTALLRIEDTDSTRCRDRFVADIYDTLGWLGLEWPEPVRVQSAHGAAYDRVLQDLAARGLIYPCSCTRRMIADAGAIPGADGMIYPGTCRGRAMSQARAGDALRLNMNAALESVEGPLMYMDGTETDARPGLGAIGDVVLRRKQSGDPAYHLACTHDDMVQGVTHVVRGRDIAAQTPIHVLLQRLMGWETPVYHHHALITDADGKRLAKVDHSRAIAEYRAAGSSAADIRAMVGF